MAQSFVIPVTVAPFIELSETDSTNNYAMALAKNGEAQHGMAVFSHHQTAGKGQRGKVWQDAAGNNIALSVLLNAKALAVSQQFRLSVAIALAAQRFLAKYLKDDIKIKWPNDIYWGDRKAAGILIENQIYGQVWQWAVAGIGINVNQTIFDPAILNAVSMKQVTGKDFNTVELAGELTSVITESFNLLINGDFKQLLAQYNHVLYGRNQTVTFKKNSAVFSCLVKEVNEQGALVAEGAAQESFKFGEVEWIIR